jgi:hypothetical protein
LWSLSDVFNFRIENAPARSPFPIDGEAGQLPAELLSCSQHQQPFDIEGFFLSLFFLARKAEVLSTEFSSTTG